MSQKELSAPLYSFSKKSSLVELCVKQRGVDIVWGWRLVSGWLWKRAKDSITVECPRWKILWESTSRTCTRGQSSSVANDQEENYKYLTSRNSGTCFSPEPWHYRCRCVYSVGRRGSHVLPRDNGEAHSGFGYRVFLYSYSHVRLRRRRRWFLLLYFSSSCAVPIFLARFTYRGSTWY